MKKFLPKTSGFTLIELMVVIAIIAILSVVAIGIYNGAQASARDAKRRVEVGALAKNIESTKDPTTGFYKYTTAESQKDYPTIVASPYVPTDPGTYAYCILGAAATTPPADPGSNWQSSTCPNMGATASLLLGTSVTGSAATTDISDASIKSWKICASMERSATPFCVSSLTN